MGRWADFDRSEVATNFAGIAAGGLDSVWLFPTLEDFPGATKAGETFGELVLSQLS